MRGTNPPPDNTPSRALARAVEAAPGGWNIDRRAKSRESRALTRSFVNRLLRLTLLAPDIQEAILDGRQAKSLQLAMLTGALPSAWEEQRQLLPTTFACAQQIQQMQGHKGTASGLSQWIPQQWF
jgi:hypothetical protein